MLLAYFAWREAYQQAEAALATSRPWLTFDVGADGTHHQTRRILDLIAPDAAGHSKPVTARAPFPAVIPNLVDRTEGDWVD